MSMAEPFVPLFGSGAHGEGTAAGGRINALANSEKSPFVPSLVGAGSTPSPAPGTAHCTNPNGEAAQPTVTLHHDGGKVTRIRIHCACGQVIDLDCVY